MGTIRDNPGNRPVNLVNKTRQGFRIADIIRGLLGANDVSADKIKTDVKLAHLLRLTLILCLFSSHSPSPRIFCGANHWIYGIPNIRDQKQ
jgi:hypothetical protein